MHDLKMYPIFEVYEISFIGLKLCFVGLSRRMGRYSFLGYKYD